MNHPRRQLLKTAGLFVVGSALKPAFAQELDLAPQTSARPLPKLLLPYLQNPSAEGVTVCVLARGAQEVGVNFSRMEDGVLGPGKARVVAASPRRVPGTEWTFWRARLSGLLPGERYQYLVGARFGDGQWLSSQSYEFGTLDPAAAELRAIVLNDIHDNLETLEAAMGRVSPEDYELSFFNGDMINNPSADDGAESVMRLWNEYVRRLNGSEKPILFIRGNHEVRGSFQDRLGYLFDLPNLDPTAAEAQQHWQFALKAGPVHFVALDTGEDDAPDTDPNSYKRPRFWEAYRRRQTTWLTRHLSQPEVRAARHRVFLSHIPLHNPSGDFSIVSRDEWSGLLAAAKFDLMLAGHDHQWRVLPAGQEFAIRDTAKRDRPPIDIVIGGGPRLEQGTIILLHASADQLQTRMLSAATGEVLHEGTHRSVSRQQC